MKIRIPKLVFISVFCPVVFVFFCYVAFQWYYSRWNVTDTLLRGLEAKKGAGGLFTIEEMQKALSEDSYIGAEDPLNRSPELVENINAFEDLLFKHPLVQHDASSPQVLDKQLDTATGEAAWQLSIQIIDQFDHAHDFMIKLMQLYADQRIPFERKSEEYQLIEEMINGYMHFLDEADDPFGIKAFEELNRKLEEADAKRRADLEWQRVERQADRVIKTLAELDQMLKVYDNERNIKSSGSQPFAEPWIMPAPSSVDSDPDAAFSESTSQTFDAEGSLSTRVDAPGSDGEASYLTDNESEVNKDTKQATPLSPERFDKAQQLIDQYGTEEGLRRFREMDPEAAQQFESDKSRPGREHRPPPTREVPSETESSTQ